MENNQQDQELLKLIKKSKRKKRLQNIFSPLLVTVLLLVTCGTLLLNYFNLGPFTGDKITGIPDNHLRLNSTNSAFNQLLFDNSNEYQLNYNGHQVELWLDYYQYGERVKTEQIGPIVAPDSEPNSKQFITSLAYGLHTSQENNIFDLTININTNGAWGKQTIHLNDYGINEDSPLVYIFGVNTKIDVTVPYSDSLYQIKKGMDYDLLIITDDGTAYVSNDKKIQFEDTPNAIALYLIFK